MAKLPFNWFRKTLLLARRHDGRALPPQSGLADAGAARREGGPFNRPLLKQLLRAQGRPAQSDGLRS